MAGNDRVNGGLGTDTLTGGAGADTFVFDTTLGASNIDTITDFRVVDDTIEMSRTVFTALGAPGPLASSAFAIGSGAQDADDHIIYNATTGALFYDADGNGSGGAVQFANLAANLNLTNADFLVV